MNKIIYLDAAASAQKPASVIDAEIGFLRDRYSNAGRGICARAVAADEMVENTRARVADFIGAAPHQIIFTSGTTDAMNRIANIIEFRTNIVAVSDLDHHSARLPFVAHGYQIKVMELDAALNLDVARMPVADAVVITAMSNVLGVAQDVGRIIRALREKNPNVIAIVDAAQFVAHAHMDVVAWDADFVCFSGHKIGADTGVGVMYIKNPELFPIDKFGGGMVSRVAENDTFTTLPAPHGWEAGTLPLTQIAGLGPAIDSWCDWIAHGGGADIRNYIYDELSKIPRIKMLTLRDAAIISFVIDSMHVLDFGALVGAHDICIRVGNMCASWIHRVIGVDGSARISVGPWNTMDDAVRVVDVIKGLVK